MNLEVARSTLMEHSRSNKNGFFPMTINFEAKLTNPLCGDHVEIKIHSDGVNIRAIGFKADACAICSASASLLSEHTKGLSVEKSLELGAIFERSILESEQSVWPKELMPLNCFEHLRVNPSRRMCALLPWVALKSALKKDRQ